MLPDKEETERGGIDVPPFLFEEYNGLHLLGNKKNIFAEYYEKAFGERPCFNCGGKIWQSWKKLQTHLINKKPFIMERKIKLKSGYLRMQGSVYTNENTTDEQLFDLVEKNPSLKKLFDIAADYVPPVVEVIKPEIKTVYQPTIIKEEFKEKKKRGRPYKK